MCGANLGKTIPRETWCNRGNRFEIFVETLRKAYKKNSKQVENPKSLVSIISFQILKHDKSIMKSGLKRD